MTVRTNRVIFATILISIWLIYFIFNVIFIPFNPQVKDEMGKDPFPETLSKALRDIEALRDQNKKLKSWLVETYQKLNATLHSKSNTDCPNIKLAHYSISHEDLRRSVTNGLAELWYSISCKLGELKNNSISLDEVRISLADQHRSILANAVKLGQVDSADDWRRNQLQNLSSLVQRRIDAIQNPLDCSKARKLLCQLNKNCGFGCQIHHATYCLIVAYFTNRTLILNTTGWRYSKKGWDSVFLPISAKCSSELFQNFITNASDWKGFEEQRNAQIVLLPYIDYLQPRFPQLPLSFPTDLADKLLLLHSNPPVWWIAQFVKYLMRYQPQLQVDLDRNIMKLSLNKGPIVGVHIRRTDKTEKEAKLHQIEEYMAFVEDWFRLQETKNRGNSLTKRIYLATDEPSVINETKLKYPEYEILADPSHSKSAQLMSRYSDSSLYGIIFDLHFLSNCDYLICTFSSQICRLAYELMQNVKWGDAANLFKSLDDIYYFGNQQGHEQIVVIAHSSNRNNSELNLLVGDTIVTAGNHWNGYSKGRNTRTGLTGLYPSYKVKEKWRIVDFPVFV